MCMYLSASLVETNYFVLAGNVFCFLVILNWSEELADSYVENFGFYHKTWPQWLRVRPLSRFSLHRNVVKVTTNIPRLHTEEVTMR